MLSIYTGSLEMVTAIDIWSVDGSAVRRLLVQPREKGQATCLWDGRDRDGRRVAAGVYYVKAILGCGALRGKIVLLR